MPIADAEERWLRAIAVWSVAGAGVVFWRGADDIFLVPKWTVIVLAAIVAAALLADRVIAVRRFVRPTEPSTVAVIAFVAGLVVATFAGRSVAASVVGDEGREIGVALYLACVLLYVAARRSHQLGAPSRLPLAMTASAAAVSAYALAQALDIDPWEWGSAKNTEVFSTMSNANFLAAWLAIALPLTIWGVLTSRRRARQLWAAAGVLVACAILATGSAQGPVAAAAGVVPLGALTVRRMVVDGDARRRRQLIAAGAVGAIALAVGAVALAGDVRESLRTRDAKWDVGIEMVKERPLTGYGFGDYDSWYRALRDAETAGSERYLANADSAHDVHLDLFDAGGVLLGGAHLAFVVTVGLVLLRGLRRLQGERQLLLAALGGSWLAYQTQALVSIDVPPLAVAHWVLAGAIVGFVRAPDSAAVASPRGARGGRPRRRTRVSEQVVTGPRVGIALVALALAWFALIPMRASIASNSAGDAASIEDAVDAYDRAAELATWETEYPNRKALLLTNTGRRDDAVAAMDEVLARNPRHFLSVSNRAKIAAGGDDAEEALRWAERLYELDPHNPGVIEILAEQLNASDRSGEAAALIEAALRDVRPRRRPPLQLELARAYIGEGDDVEARSLLTRLLESDFIDDDLRAEVSDELESL